jgi:hypothetical protein
MIDRLPPWVPSGRQLLLGFLIAYAAAQAIIGLHTASMIANVGFRVISVGAIALGIVAMYRKPER